MEKKIDTKIDRQKSRQTEKRVDGKMSRQKNG